MLCVIYLYYASTAFRKKTKSSSWFGTIDFVCCQEHVSFVDKIGERRISMVPRVCVHVRRRCVWHRKKSGFIYFFYARAATQIKKGKENLSLRTPGERITNQTTFPIAMHLNLRYFPAMVNCSSLVIDGREKISKLKRTLHRGQVVSLDLYI